MRLDCGVDLGPFTIAYQTYGTLNAERSERHPDLPRADRRPVRRRPAPDHRQRRLVDHRWSGPASVLDTERYFLICANVLGGCMGTTGPKEINPATGEPWALGFPVITIRDMVRAQKLLIDHLGIEQLFCVIGGSMGGMQVLQWAASYPEAVFAAVPIADGGAALGAEHRLPRGRPAGDHGRPGLVRRRLSEPAAASRRAASRWRAWRRTSPICRKRRCTANSAATCRTATRSPTGSTPISRSRATCATRASPSSTASTPIRISTSRARWIISTSPPSMAGRAGGAFRGPQPRFCIDLVHQRLAVPDLGEPRRRPCAERGRRQCQLRRDRDRQGPRRLPAARAGVVRDAARLSRPAAPSIADCRGWKAAHERQRRAATTRGRARACRRRAAPDELRRDLRLIADMIEPGSRVLDIGCGDGALARLSGAREGGRRARHRAEPVRRQCLRAARAVGDPGRRRHDLDAYPERRLRCRRAEPDLAGDAPARARCSRNWCASASGRSCRSPISASGASACGLLFDGRMPVTELLNHPWYETPNIHLCTIRDFVVLCDEIGARIERSVPLDRHGSPFCARSARHASPICWPSRACSCCAGERISRRLIAGGHR